MKPKSGKTEAPAILVENVSKVYPLYGSHRDRLKEALHPFRKKYHRDFYALRDVSFEVYRGETVGIVGRNGSGKSTLLSVIAGILQPTRGKVEVKGRISSLLELGAGFNPELSGMENIFFYGLIAGFGRKEMETKLQSILNFAGIGDFVHQPMKVYSSGMFVRLAFACAIHIEPEILIVDEALAVGDMNFQAKCMTAIHRIQESGATVLFVSHDIGSIKSLCSRALYLENGSPVFFGPASEATAHYLRKMREELSEETRKFTRVSTEFGANGQDTTLSEDGAEKQSDSKEISAPVIEFKRSQAFDEAANLFRYGTGGARVSFAELLDEFDQPVKSLEFDQRAKLNIYFEALEDTMLSVNFYVEDDKKILLFGGGPRLFGGQLLNCSSGQKYIATFQFRTPLQDGNYSIQTQITKPIVLDETADFLDVVENAVVFNVQRKPISKLWTKVFIPVKVTIAEIN